MQKILDGLDNVKSKRIVVMMDRCFIFDGVFKNEEITKEIRFVKIVSNTSTRGGLTNSLGGMALNIILTGIIGLITSMFMYRFAYEFELIIHFNSGRSPIHLFTDEKDLIKMLRNYM